MEILIGLFADGHVVIKSSMLDFKNMVRGAGISAAIAFGLSMNLTSGRMDLSLGSQRVVATIVGGIVASKLGLGGAWVLLFCNYIRLNIWWNCWLLICNANSSYGIRYRCCLYLAMYRFWSYRWVGLRLVGTKGVEILSNVNFTCSSCSNCSRYDGYYDIYSIQL